MSNLKFVLKIVYTSTLPEWESLLDNSLCFIGLIQSFVQLKMIVKLEYYSKK